MDWLVVGLGNPGRKYARTRHNAGAMAIEALIGRSGGAFAPLSPDRRLKALVSKGQLAGQRVLLAFPQTFMNLSGDSVRAAADFYGLPPERVLIVSDDKDLPIGAVRLRLAGSAGGHNGLKSIIARLGTQEFPRLKIGVGTALSQDRRVDAADFVLARPSKEEMAELQAAVERAAEAIEAVIAEGAEKVAGRLD